MTEEISDLVVLYVDDYESLRKMAQDLGNMYGVRVLTASSGNEGIGIYDSNPNIDGVITDWRMPDGDGESVTRHIKKDPRNTPLVVYSSTSEKDIHKKLDKNRKIKEKLRKEKSNVRRKRVFHFFRGLGLVKTEEEKKEIKKRRERVKRQKELEKKRREEERIRLEEDRKKREIEKQKKKEQEIKKIEEEERKRQRGIERQQKQDEKRKQKKLGLKKKEEEKKIKKDERKLEEKVPKKKPFLGLFGKKKVDMELEKELKEIEEIAPKPIKKVKEEKLEIPELEEIEKEIEKPELASAEEEIQKAIQGMKVKKRPSIVKRLWKKKEKVKERIETPEVMPRTYDKIDYVELIEEKMHKARLALMDFKFDEAKRIYIEIMRMYNDLEPKKKVKVYQDIKDLYYERKSAEKFAK